MDRRAAKTLRWLIGMRLVVVSTLFVGILLIQVNTQLILPLRSFYGLILLSYGLSLFYLILQLRNVPAKIQAGIQLVGDLVVVTGFVYVTGGVFSPFSFLYLAVIVVAVIVSIILLIYVIPTFERIFKDFGADLPAFRDTEVAVRGDDGDQA